MRRGVDPRHREQGGECGTGRRFGEGTLGPRREGLSFESGAGGAANDRVGVRERGPDGGEGGGVGAAVKLFEGDAQGYFGRRGGEGLRGLRWLRGARRIARPRETINGGLGATAAGGEIERTVRRVHADRGDGQRHARHDRLGRCAETGAVGRELECDDAAVTPVGDPKRFAIMGGNFRLAWK